MVASLLIALYGTGCIKREQRQQFELESFTAGTIQRSLSLHEGNSSGEPITNVAQIFAMMDLTSAHRGHPYVLQQRFREFGPTAGFTNSIYEKYVILPRGITNRAIKGEMTLMSAQPFQDLDGRAIRMIIWKAGEQDYRSTELREERVQEMFRDINRTIPVPERMPSPPIPPGFARSAPSLLESVELYFRDVAGNLGVGRGSWWILLLLLGIGVVAIVTTLILFSVSRHHHRR